ncbi:MAG: hypothetical protein KJ056_05365 [Acidimicrobiia bacterium]|nr:hypothetical protein [Acidimicrobiia bacterium]
MRRREWWAVVLVTAVAAAGCGGGGEGGGADREAATRSSDRAATPSSAATTTTGSGDGLPDRDAVRGALLTPADLPAGWSAGGPGPTGDDGSAPGLDEWLCPAAEGELPARFEEVVLADRVEFSKSEMGPVILQGAAATTDAVALFEQAAGALGACVGTEWEQTNPDNTVTTFRLRGIEIDDHGDDQFAYRLETTGDGARTRSDVVVVRDGDVLTMFVGLGSTSAFGGELLDPAELAEVVDTGVAKLAAL